jgi:hypothetical protein
MLGITPTSVFKKRTMLRNTAIRPAPCKSRDTSGDRLTSGSWGPCQTPHWQRSWEQRSILSSQSVSLWEYRLQDRLQKLEDPGQKKNLQCSDECRTRKSHKRLVVVDVTFEANENRSVSRQVRSSLTEPWTKKMVSQLGKAPGRRSRQKPWCQYCLGFTATRSARHCRVS